MLAANACFEEDGIVLPKQCRLEGQNDGGIQSFKRELQKISLEVKKKRTDALISQVKASKEKGKYMKEKGVCCDEEGVFMKDEQRITDESFKVRRNSVHVGTTKSEMLRKICPISSSPLHLPPQYDSVGGRLGSHPCELPPPFESIDEPPSFETFENSDSLRSSYEKPHIHSETVKNSQVTSQTMNNTYEQMFPLAQPMQSQIHHEVKKNYGNNELNHDGIVTEPSPPSFEQYENMESSLMYLSMNSNNMSQQMKDEQVHLLEEFKREKIANVVGMVEGVTNDFKSQNNKVTCINATESVSSDLRSDALTISVSGMKLRFRGEKETKSAITDGTAIIVQCVSCSSWMQIASSATYMFCPACSTISRPERRNRVKTIEEAKKKMSEKSRDEKIVDAERRRKEKKNLSWGNYLKSYFTNVKVKSEDRIGTSNQRVLKDGSFASQNEKSGISLLFPVQTDETGMLLPPRVAESKPFYSCVAGLAKNFHDAFSNGKVYEAEKGYEGLENTALLSVTRAARINTGDKSYIFM